MTPSPPLISIRKLTKTYSSPEHRLSDKITAEPVLQEIDLDVADGEFVIFVGRSGSGKSTLLNLIGAMDTPDKGEVVVNDITLGKLDDEQRSLYRRNKIGFIFQTYNLIPTLTVEENLTLPLYLNGSSDVSKINEYLQQLGLLQRKNYWPDQLSGGEQQRVAILRALIHKPRVLIADEPTGNLDSSSAADVMELLVDMVRAHNTTLLLATHNMELCALADRVFNIEAGKLRAL